MSATHIELRGVEVHNLKQIDVDIPHHRLVVICGVSGSGKTSLALDTLYAEGQRRYIESFSAYTRQFLARLEKPAAERIDGIPPSIAVAQQNHARSGRANVGTATEIIDYLRLLVAKVGETFCCQCDQPVRRDDADSLAKMLAQVDPKTRFMVTYPVAVDAGDSDSNPAEKICSDLREDGFLRVIVEHRTRRLDEGDAIVASLGSGFEVVVDRLTGATDASRVRDSLETAFSHGEGRAAVWFFADAAGIDGLFPQRGSARIVDDRQWTEFRFNRRLVCAQCDIAYPPPSPNVYSFNSPLGACPTCEGYGNVMGIDMDLVVPDRKKTLRDGAVAPWNTPAYAHELAELLALAADFQLPVDVPYSQLRPEHLRLIQEGVPDREFGGLRGFFQWLEKRKYKMHVRVFLSRWRSYTPCPDCRGDRLRKESLATRIGGKNIAEICRMKIGEAAVFFADARWDAQQRQIGRLMLEQIEARLQYLRAVGLDYLTLDRPLRTLSGGEAQRVALTSALGSSLVNTLYVLDEPSVGLHPQDVDKLLQALFDLRRRGNSVIVVEHEESILRAADQLIEMGPGAGEAGGRVVFQGDPADITEDGDSLTGDYLAGRRGRAHPTRRRETNHGWISITGARGNNLQNLSVEFPLGVLCVVTGVSGAGKSSLVLDTLYPALCRRKRKDAAKPLPHDEVLGDGQIDDVVSVDQGPIGKSPRSNPVTYIKAFDAIRAVFADTVEARTHNYSASQFSFNVDGGRCAACQGDGYVRIDMQFLADVYMKCSQCQGQRYRQEILDVKYRGRNIADVLDMTVRQAHAFFRGQDKVRARLTRLLDVGLDYLRLGQPANTLSAGEAQRLKQAGYLGPARRSRTLFFMDEPTTGLHFNDIVNLLDCMDALLAAGHSLIVIEHNLQLIQAADYVIDMGPGAAEDGGRVVTQGPPEFVAQQPHSRTAPFLASLLAAGPMATGA